MTSKSRKHAPQVEGDEASMEAANTSASSGKRRKEKRRNSNGNKKPMKSIKESIRNKFQRIKGKKGGMSNNSVASSSVASADLSTELDDLVYNPPRYSTPKAATKPPPPTTTLATTANERSSPVAIRAKTTTPPSKQTKSTSKTIRKVSKAKNKGELPLQHIKKATEKQQKKQPREKPRERRPKSPKTDPVSAYKKYQKKTEQAKKKKKKAKPPAPRESSKEFRSFSDSSDYSDTDFERSYDSDASSVYSDPGFAAVSYNDSDSSRSRSDSEESHSESSHSSDSSYSSDETEGVTMRTERSAWKRNPETRSQPRRKKSVPVRGHIRSPRSSPRKKYSTQIRSSPRTRGNVAKRRFFRDDEDDDDDDSDASSYVSGTSYYSSESDASESSGSSYSDSESNDDEYYTTSYDEDPRNLRDSTYSASWTDGPISTYGSEETERTRVTVLKDISTRSMDESQQGLKSRSTGAVNSRDIGSIDEDENTYDEFLREKEAAERVERERTEAKRALGGQQQDIQENDSGVLSWILGASMSSQEEEKEDRDATNVAKARSKDNRAREHKSPIRARKEKGENDRISSPPHSPRSSRSQQTIRSPRSPQSAASSRKDFIVRDRRSAIHSDDDPTLSPGCNVNLDQILVAGDSMPGSYGGLKDGEFLVPNHDESESSDKDEANGEELSVTMRGSGTLGADNDDADDGKSNRSRKSAAAPHEIAFSPRSPAVTSPLSRSGRGDSQIMVADEGGVEEEDSSFLYCCFAPENNVKENEFNRMAAAKTKNSAFNFNDDAISALLDDNVDDSTCASTIHTASKFEKAPSSSHQEVDEGKNENTIGGQSQDKNDESSSCAEKIELELGPYTSGDYSASFDGANTEAEEANEAESTKRIKAESLDDYDISEILHGKRSFKSKTDDDGVPIPVASPTNASGRRERRKMALKAHREFLYKTRSIDSNASFPKEEAGDADDNSIAAREGKANNGDSSSTGPSVLSNSIVQEDASIPNEGKPDALLELVRNAFSSMMMPSNEGSTSETVENGNVDSGVSKNEGDRNAQPSSGPIDDVLEAAFRFFVPKEEASPLITEEKESMRITSFNPNPGAKSKAVDIEDESNSFVADSDDSASTGSSSSMEETNISDTAVLPDSRSKTKPPSSSRGNDESRFNADGIPLTLRPKKIWRAFDSGYSVSQSVVTTGASIQTGELANSSASTEPKSNRRHGTIEKLDERTSMSIGDSEKQKHSESPSKLKIETRELSTNNEGSGGMRLSTSPRYKRRAEMKRMKALKSQQQDKPTTEDNARQAVEESESEISPRKERLVSPKEHSSISPTKPSPTSSAVNQTSPLAIQTGGTTIDPPADVASPDPPADVASPDPEPSPTTGSSPRRSNNESNINDIRARIKHRQRSKFQRQQLRQQQALKQTVSKKSKRTSQKSSSGMKLVQVTPPTDRRDDSFSEFYDAITYDDVQTKEKPRRQRGSRNKQSNVRDERESILSGAMSLD